MRKFDEKYVLLSEMSCDEYFPDYLVDRIKMLMSEVIDYLETGEESLAKIQGKLDEMTLAINDLQEQFEDQGSEIETVARDDIGVSVGYILDWFGVNIKLEDAIGEREW